MPDGYNGTVCNLLKQPLIQWNGAQTLPGSKCKAAEVDNDPRDCWYSDPSMNKSFAEYCSHDKCSCEAIEKMAMGKEAGAMCHEGGHGRRRQLDEAPEEPPPYWTCSQAVRTACGSYRHNPTGCESCATTHAATLKAAGCTTEFIDHACSANFDSCDTAVSGICAEAIATGSEQACVQCALNNTAALMDANCTAEYLEYACGGGGGHSNPWEEYISELGCLLNGTWFSTREEGECKAGQNPATDDCWWTVGKVGRTVNQTCVDE